MATALSDHGRCTALACAFTRSGLVLFTAQPGSGVSDIIQDTFLQSASLVRYLILCELVVRVAICAQARAQGSVVAIVRAVLGQLLLLVVVGLGQLLPKSRLRPYVGE